MAQDMSPLVESSPDEPAVSAPVEQPAAPFNRVQVIINPASGQDRPILGTMNNAFHRAGIDWDISVTKQQGDAFRLARSAVTAGVNAVVVYGGDGTVMEVSNALGGTDVPLAIIPGGTANVMSVELGIPGDLAEALALVCSDVGVVRAVDMGSVRDQKFMLRLGIGFWAEVTRNAAREAKNQMGNLAYILSAVQQLAKVENAHYQLWLDGESVEIDGVACMIANSGNLGLPGMKLSKKIDVSDGLLDVVIVRATDVGTLLSLAANAFGVVDNLPHWQAREIELHSDPPQSIECDGEMLEPTPVAVQVLPQSLKVIVPRSAVPLPPL